MSRAAILAPLFGAFGGERIVDNTYCKVLILVNHASKTLVCGGTGSAFKRCRQAGKKMFIFVDVASFYKRFRCCSRRDRRNWRHSSADRSAAAHPVHRCPSHRLSWPPGMPRRPRRDYWPRSRHGPPAHRHGPPLTRKRCGRWRRSLSGRDGRAGHPSRRSRRGW